MAVRNQQTIATSTVVEGFGYWSGRDVRVEFRPVPAGSGVVFVRSDIQGNPRIPVDVTSRVEIPRRTTLDCDGVRVDMVEHVLAALAGLRIDNCEVWVDEPEMPGCDGSSAEFVDALLAAGIVGQSEPRPYRVVTEVIRVGDEESWVEARPAPVCEMQLQYELDYGPGSPIVPQSHSLTLTPDSFRRELAPCRTFLLKAEADWLLSQGLGTRVTSQDLLIFDDNGPIDNEVHHENECVRHKLLDLVGDLALAGCDLIGRFSACKSGHRLNAELVGQLLDRTEVVRRRRECA